MMRITPIPLRGPVLSAVFLGLLWVQLLPLIPAQINGIITQICTRQGVQQILLAAQDTPLSPQQSPEKKATKPCPFCLVRQAVSLDMPEIFSAAPLQHSEVVSYYFFEIFVPAYPVQGVHARGPPAFF